MGRFKGGDQAEIGSGQAPEQAPAAVAHIHIKGPQVIKCQHQADGRQETEQEGANFRFRTQIPTGLEQPQGKENAGNKMQEGSRLMAAKTLHRRSAHHHRRQQAHQCRHLIQSAGGIQQFRDTHIGQHQRQQHIGSAAHLGARIIHFIAPILTGRSGHKPQKCHDRHADAAKQQPCRMAGLIQTFLIDAGILQPKPQDTANNRRQQHKAVGKTE